MNVLVLKVFVASALVTMVQAGCSYMGFNTQDLTPLCEKWWDKGLKYENNNSEREKCISLIKKKCPKMIKIVETFTRRYDVSQPKYEYWTTEVKATLSNDPETWMIYKLLDTKDLCSTDNGHTEVKDCDYWWKVAREEKLEEKYKIRCINRIVDYCSYRIRRVKADNKCTAQRCGKVYNVNIVTFSYNNDGQVTVERYEKL